MDSEMTIGNNWLADISAFGHRVAFRLKTALRNDSGMATLETVLLIAVLIALVLMFKNAIVDFVDGILDNISSQSSVFDPASIAP